MSTDGMVRIFRRVLETEDVHIDSDFFAAGGDSLLATRVLSAIAKEYGTELSFADFLSAPCPRGLVEKLAEAGA